MKKNVTLMHDMIFKIVFGQQQNEPLLRALLNALLGRTGDERITELTIKSPNLDKDHVADRGVVLDVKARDGHGRLYNIEVQVTEEGAFVHRSLYCLARLFSGQLVKGRPFEELAQTIAISLVDFVLFPDVDDVHSTYRFHDRVHDRPLTDVLEMHYIELVKFDKDKPHQLRTPFEKWLHVIKFGELYARDLEPLPEVLRAEEGVQMAIDKMRQARASDEVRELIWAREKAALEEGNRLALAERKGRKEGREQGREEGLNEGREEGASESSLRIARRLFARGTPLQEVVELTGIDPTDLDAT